MNKATTLTGNNKTSFPVSFFQKAEYPKRPLTDFERQFYTAMNEHYLYMVALRPECRKTKQRLDAIADILVNGLTTTDE